MMNQTTLGAVLVKAERAEGRYQKLSVGLRRGDGCARFFCATITGVMD